MKPRRLTIVDNNLQLFLKKKRQRLVSNELTKSLYLDRLKIAHENHCHNFFTTNFSVYGIKIHRIIFKCNPL